MRIQFVFPFSGVRVIIQVFEIFRHLGTFRFRQSNTRVYLSVLSLLCLSFCAEDISKTDEGFGMEIETCLFIRTHDLFAGSLPDLLVTAGVAIEYHVM